jgi:deoxyribonuclease-4
MPPMLPDGRRLGAHLPLGRGMLKAVDRAAEIGADTLQIFTDNPAAWRRRPEPPAELPAFRTRIEELGLGPVAVHASYLVNLAGSDDALWERSIEMVIHELRQAPAFGVRFVNVHVGSHTGSGAEAGTVRVAEAVRRVLAGVPATAGGAVLVLENSAGSGDGLGVDVRELAAIAEACRAAGIDEDRLAFCLDTAHAWSAGHPFDEPAGVDAFLESFDAELGLARLVMVHLNDSRSERGSRVDRHEHLGAGRIGPAGLRRVLTHPGLRHVVTYLETPGMDEGYDAVNLARARSIAAGEPLASLPPDAPTGSRSRRTTADPAPERVA